MSAMTSNAKSAGAGLVLLVLAACTTQGGNVDVSGDTRDASDNSPIDVVGNPGSAGRPDPGFGVAGLARTGFAGRDLGRTVAEQVIRGTSMLLAGGKIGNAGATSFLLVRYTASGQLDPSFGPPGASPGGVVTVRFSPNSFDEGKALLVQPDGAIVLAGITTVGGDGRFGVARFDANGNLDATFDGDGMASVDFGPGNDEGKTAGLQPCGVPAETCIVVAGKAMGADGQGDFAWARLDARGRLDRRVTTDLGGPNDEANDMVVLPDGSFVLVGETGNATSSAVAVVRYGAAGDLDHTFGDPDATRGRTGSAITRLGGGERAFAVAADRAGRLLVVGTTPGTNGSDILALRYTPDGRLDPDFDGDGVRTIRIDGTEDYATGVVVDGQDRVSIAARSTTSTGSEFLLFRLTSQGADDPAFGQAGRAVLQPAVPVSTENDDGAYRLVAQGDGRLVMVGELAGATGNDLTLVRVLP